MNRLAFPLLICALGAFCAKSVRAQDAGAPALPTEITWSSLLQIVHDRSPRLHAMQSEALVARADIAVAGVRPNPSLDYTGYGLLDHGDNYGMQHQIGIELPLLIGGQRDARMRTAKRRAETAQAEVAVSETQLERDALHAFVELLAAQNRSDELDKARAEVAAISHTVHERVSAGAESQYDAARVDLESAQLDAHLAQAHADVTEASAGVAAAVGLPGWQPRAVGALAPLDIDESFKQLWSKARETLPELHAAQSRVLAADSEIDLARSERWPVPTLSAGTVLTSDHKSISAFVGISAPLPVLDFGGAAIDRAGASLDAAQAEREASLAEARAALTGATADLIARRAALDAYEHGIGDRLPGLRDMAETAYKSGSASLLELLDSLRSEIDIQLGRIDVVGGVLNAEIDVLVSAGLLHESPKLNAPATPSPAAKHTG